MSTIKSSAENLTLNADGANNDIKFQSNGSEVASIDQAGVIVSAGGSTHADNVKAKFGTGNDLEIYHDGSNSYIDDAGTGDVILRGNGNVTFQKYTGETLANFTADGDCTLRFNNVQQLATLATGASIGSTSSSQTHLDIITNTSSYGGVYFQDGADEAHRGAVQYKHGDDFMHMYTAGTERMRIHSNGVTSIPAGVALGVGTANTASNVLDDYEKGTHECAITMGSGTATLHSSKRFLKYVKIGDQVTVSGQIQISAVSNPSGAFQISLPFTCSGDESDFSVGNYRSYSVDTPGDGVQAVIYSDRGTAKASLEWSRDSASPTNENATNGGYYMIGLTYFTT